MRYRTLAECVADLRAHGHLVPCDEPLEARGEVAEVHRRVFARGGPAVLYTRVAGCRFPLVSNLFGTLERARFIFRHTWDRVRRAIDLRLHPHRAWRRPTQSLAALGTLKNMRPVFRRSAEVLRQSCALSDLPAVVAWPRDGGPFITLPLVLSQDVGRPGWRHSNLGMYRIQLGGGLYAPERQVGLHYQLHRGIGVHHRAALEAGKPFRVDIFVGGSPAMTLAAVMPLPESMSELGFAGALAGYRIPLCRQGERLVYADADFYLSGTVDPQQLLPEGPFGDHLGYYSLVHEFPVLNVDRVSHRPGAVWPFTVVGRPPQEDTIFGQLIHELTEPVLPTLIPGVHGVHAVDAAGVHPLLLAIGSERYDPYRGTTRPQELLTQANAILGQGQLSLAKYVWIIDRACDRSLRVSDAGGLIARVLERVDGTRDLHFQTRTTIDTLDYSGEGLHQGSKVVIAAAGPPRRRLAIDASSIELPAGFRPRAGPIPGVLVIQGPPFPAGRRSDPSLAARLAVPPLTVANSGWPLAVVVDDADFVASSLESLLWVAFTRSNPAADLHGIDSFVEDKHWGYRGSLLIDARIKPHHAPALEPDPQVAARIDAVAARGGPLARWL